MANVRYMGGNSATLGTKEIDVNGTYNASSDGLDGYSSVNVDVPAPTGSISLEYTGNGQYSEDVSQYATADITVDVPIPTVNTQTKTITASTSQQTVVPDPGYLLEQVTVNPQQNTGTYTPASDTASNDMGPINNYRYVDTSGMILPTGSKTVTIESNGNYTENVSDKATVDITVNVPVSGDLGTKTIITNGTYQALDDNLDGYSEVTVNVPQNATLGIKAITNNGSYNAITDGYDGYSRVDVNVQGAALQSSKTVTATTSQQTVTPDQGYDGLEQVIVDPQVHTQTYTPADNTAANDMGAQNNYRYVNTSGMVTPSSITPSNSSPAALTSGSAVTPSANGYAIESYSLANPAEGTRMTSGNFYKATDNGLIIDDIETLAAGSGTDDTIEDGKNYHAVGDGIAIQGFTSITPSNSSPVSLSSGNYYKPTASGYAISSYSSKTPSDSSPASVSSGAIIKASASGYLYATQQPKVTTGTFTRTTSRATTINCGFTPDMIILMKGSGTTTTISTGDFRAIYWKDWSTSYVVDDYRSSSGYYLKNEPVSDFLTFTSTGFVYAKASSSTYAGTVKYIAVKYT